MIFIFGIMSLIVIFFIFLNYHSSIKYRPSKEEIKVILKKAIDGTIKPREWDQLVCVPIKYDKYLEEIREKCEKLNNHTEFFSKSTDSYFSELGIKEISKILWELENRERIGLL